jgi:hypothetical protein
MLTRNLRKSSVLVDSPDSGSLSEHGNLVLDSTR